MKTKLLLVAATATCMLASASAYAGVIIEPVVEFGQPAPIMVAPAPVYYAPPPAVIVHPWVEGYDPYHHRTRDWRYWQERRHHEHEEHEHWEHR